MTFEQALPYMSIILAIVAPIAQVLFDRFLQRRDLRIAVSNKDKPEEKKAPNGTLRKIGNIIIFIIPVTTLFREVLSGDPVTRMSAFIIALSVSSLISIFIFQFFHKAFLMLLDVQSRTNEINGGLLQNQRDLLDAQREHIAVTKNFVKDSGAKALHPKLVSKQAERPVNPSPKKLSPSKGRSASQ